MKDEPSGLEVLFLWRLAVAGGGDWQADLKPALDAPVRRRLAGAGLIEQDQRSPGAGKRKRLYIALSDRGWQWLAEHLDTPIATRSPASLEVLVRLLARLKIHLDQQGLALGEFIASRPREREQPALHRDGLDARVEAACMTLLDGRRGGRIRLADLRAALAGVSRAELDAALLQMAAAGTASLYRLDDPLEITTRDRDATLRTPSGEERHLVYLRGTGS